MKHAFLLSTCLAGIFFCLCGLSACKQPIVYPADFAVADSLASADPDRAVEMLASWKEEMKLKPEHVRNYYQLLCIKANDKAYITHTSDSIIKCLVRYYETDGDKRRLPETYYYAGRVLRDMENAPLAIEYFEKALDVADGEEHLFLKGKIYSQMGRIFYDQQLTEQALVLIRLACQYDIQNNDTEALSHDLSNIADIHWDRFQLDSAEFYYKASIALMETLKDTLDINMMKTQLGHLYIDLHRYNEVEDLIQPYLNHHYEFDKKYIYSIAAKYFLATEQWDSAHFYYEKCFSFDNIFTKRSACWGFSQIAIAHNNPEESQYYLTQYKLCQDSIQKLNQAQEVGLTYFKHNYELREKENKRLKEKNARKQRYFTIILSVFGISLGGIISYMIHYRRKKKIFATTETRNTPDPDTLPPSSQQTEAPIHVASAEKTIVSSVSKYPNPSPEPIDFRPKDDTNIKTVKTIILPQVPDPAIPLTELSSHLTDMANKDKILAENDWMTIEAFIRKNHPDFITKLCEAYSCNILEFRVSMLIKLNIPPATIARFIGRSKESVSSIRRRLYEKAFAEKGTAKKWDAFIHTL